MPSVNEQAEFFKQRGNENFSRGDLGGAIEWYTKAINIDPEQHVYWQNRALCHLKRKEWAQVVHDSRKALNFEEESVKAHYFLGLGLVESGESSEGLRKLLKAKSLASAQQSKMEKEIEHGILRANKTIWLQEAVSKESQRQELQGVLRQGLDRLAGDGGRMDMELRVEQMEHMFFEDRRERQDREVPDYLCCKITMELMRDPVITPSGVTYERQAIVSHLKQNGKFDPVSRKPCTEDQLVPNLSVKEAVDSFLEKHPWAYEEDSWTQEPIWAKKTNKI
eukprot:GDKI01020973.1.p1 GENE.GDKI01020973.1~~GDKI01020973.1.p1  ORF type:complete len:291 (+),score=46.21 GDKI01020973.1:39-875(+)